MKAMFRYAIVFVMCSFFLLSCQGDSGSDANTPDATDTAESDTDQDTGTDEESESESDSDSDSESETQSTSEDITDSENGTETETLTGTGDETETNSETASVIVCEGLDEEDCTANGTPESGGCCPEYGYLISRENNCQETILTYAGCRAAEYYCGCGDFQTWGYNSEHCFYFPSYCVPDGWTMGWDDELCTSNGNCVK